MRVNEEKIWDLLSDEIDQQAELPVADVEIESEDFSLKPGEARAFDFPWRGVPASKTWEGKPVVGNQVSGEFYNDGGALRVRAVRVTTFSDQD